MESSHDGSRRVALDEKIDSGQLGLKCPPGYWTFRVGDQRMWEEGRKRKKRKRGETIDVPKIIRLDLLEKPKNEFGDQNLT